MSIWLNRLAPDFSLPMVEGGRFSLSAWRGFVVVVNFWSAECTWSRRADVLLVYRALTWEPKGVRIVGVACNANEPESEVRYEAQYRNLKYPVVLDTEQRVTNLYKAEMTPEFFVLDRQGTVRYTGALDNATPRSRDGRTLYLDMAVSALLADRMPDPASTPPFGCSIVRRVPALGTF
jgi:peroxiredoxin